MSIPQYSLNQTCSDATFTCYQSAITADFEGIRAQFIKKLRNAGAVKNDISDNLLPTYKTQIQSMIDDLDSNWSTELTNYVTSVNELNHDKYLPYLRSVYIKEVSTGKCLTYMGYDGQYIFTTCSNLNVNQMFKFYSISSSYWIQFKGYSSYFVVNYSNTNTNGNKIRACAVSNVDIIRWTPKVSGSGFKLVNPATNKCLQCNTSDFGAELWDCNNTGKQIFKIVIAEI